MNRDTLIRILKRLRRAGVVDWRPGPRRARLYGLTENVRETEERWGTEVALLLNEARLLGALLRDRASADAKIGVALYHFERLSTRAALELLVHSRRSRSNEALEREASFYALIQDKLRGLLSGFVSRMRVPEDDFAGICEAYYRSVKPPPGVEEYEAKQAGSGLRAEVRSQAEGYLRELHGSSKFLSSMDLASLGEVLDREIESALGGMAK